MVSSQYIGDIELRVAGKPENLEACRAPHSGRH